MSKTYLCVFINDSGSDSIKDVGDDPCFENAPTWGICRPLTRRSLTVGDTLFFFAKTHTNYILKGWFEVGEKIDYATALLRFPNRKNVILSRFKRAADNTRWRHLPKLKGSSYPFLTQINAEEGEFYQNEIDDHQLDNWKCRRIFLCNKNQFLKCLDSNFCQKSGESLTNKTYSNYIVANPNKWDDLAYLNITFSELSSATGFTKQIKTPANQHNVLRFDDFKEASFKFIELRKQDINREA